MKPNTPEWELERFKGIGASDAPIILNLSPWKTAIELYHEKVNRTHTEPSYPMIRGKELEPYAVATFADSTGFNVEYDTDDCFVKSKERPWQFATFDGLIDDGSFVEIKCPMSRKSHEMALSKKVPDHYFAQMQHQFSIRPCEKAYYFSYFCKDGDVDAIVLEVFRDDMYIQKLLEKEEEFWHCIVDLNPPKNPF
jgi:putative phage-type endonuclease